MWITEKIQLTTFLLAAYLSYCQLALIELISSFDKIYLLLVRGLDLIIDLIFRYVIQFSSHESELKRRASLARFEVLKDKK